MIRFRQRPRTLEGTDRSAPPVTATAPADWRSLVVLDPDAPSTTLWAALQHPDVTDGALDLLVVLPTAEYEARRRARFEADVTAPYTIDHLEAEARRIAQRAGREWLDPIGVEFEPLGAVGRLRNSIRATVEDRGDTRVYVAAPERPIWKRVFGFEEFSASLAGVLPTAVTVVPVDAAIDSALNVADPGTRRRGDRERRNRRSHPNEVDTRGRRKRVGTEGDEGPSR